MLSRALFTPTKRWNFLLNDDKNLCHRFKEIVELVLLDQNGEQSQNERSIQLRMCLDKLFQSEDMGWEFIYRNIPTYRKEGTQIIFKSPAFFVSTYILGLSLQDIFLEYHEFVIKSQRFDRQGFMKKHSQAFLALNLLAKDHATTFEKTLPNLEKEQRILFKEWLESVSRYITHNQTYYWYDCYQVMIEPLLNRDHFKTAAQLVAEINSAIMSIHRVAWHDNEDYYKEPIDPGHLRSTYYTPLSLKNVSRAYIRLLELKKHLQSTISLPLEQTSFDFNYALKNTQQLLDSIGHPDMAIFQEETGVAMQREGSRDVYTQCLTPTFYTCIRETPNTAMLAIDYVSCEELADIFSKPSAIQTRGKRKYPEPLTSGIAAAKTKK
ncbi:MAG: hypothetical protein B0D91_09035 [Oceanospirillales bacterium LUC14_002_19_P2]|nr:MAG: hypothetical protein B0D91_09035 [Oceanospirillales bacterium LUC14_002_19_P2]